MALASTSIENQLFKIIPFKSHWEIKYLYFFGLKVVPLLTTLLLYFISMIGRSTTWLQRREDYELTTCGHKEAVEGCWVVLSGLPIIVPVYKIISNSLIPGMGPMSVWWASSLDLAIDSLLSVLS